MGLAFVNKARQDFAGMTHTECPMLNCGSVTAGFGNNRLQLVVAALFCRMKLLQQAQTCLCETRCLRCTVTCHTLRHLLTAALAPVTQLACAL